MSQCECGVCGLCELCELMKEKGLTMEQAFSAYEAWEAAKMEKHGWIVHYVIDGSPNFHTHGLPDKLGHPDLQIVVSLPPKVAHGLFVGAVEQIEAGKRFEDGDYASKIVKNYKVKFVEAEEGDRTVLRMILPDSDGNLEPGRIGGGLEFQYDDLGGQ